MLAASRRISLSATSSTSMACTGSRTRRQFHQPSHNAPVNIFHILSLGRHELILVAGYVVHPASGRMRRGDRRRCPVPKGLRGRALTAAEEPAIGALGCLRTAPVRLGERARRVGLAPTASAVPPWPPRWGWRHRSGGSGGSAAPPRAARGWPTRRAPAARPAGIARLPVAT